MRMNLPVPIETSAFWRPLEPLGNSALTRCKHSLDRRYRPTVREQHDGRASIRLGGATGVEGRLTSFAPSSVLEIGRCAGESRPNASYPTQNQHKAFNLLLNSRVEESAHPSYPAAPVRYAHTRELDTFHDVTLPGGGGRRKVRVTRDQKDKSRVSAVEKVRVADMNVFSPKRRFDWRVSVSLEMPGACPSLVPHAVRARLTCRFPAPLDAQPPCPTRLRRTRGTRTASRTRTSTSASTSRRCSRPSSRSRRTSSRSSSSARGRSSRRRPRSSAARTTGTSRWCRACSTTFVSLVSLLLELLCSGTPVSRSR